MSSDQSPVPASPAARPRHRLRVAAAAALLGATFLTTPFLADRLPAQAAAPITAPSTAGILPGSFADLVEKVSPAVVTISTTQGGPADADDTAGPPGLPDFQFPPGSPFEELFRHFFDQMPGPGGPGKPGRGHPGPAERRASLGSGFIIDPSGYVVTNNHVVDGGSDIAVVFNDDTKLKARLVGRDEKTDLALLKVEAPKPLPYLQFGDSDKARAGDWVIAVGNPFGLGGTVTAGIISARGRDIQSGPYDDFLQLDASINRGNSGGPTFDVNGNVIGINTAIFSPNGGSVGIGFAIPANLARPVIEQLKEHGSVDRGWLGVQIQAVTPEIADSIGLSQPKGALVAEVTPNSPAARAGIKQGDVIIGFNGQPVEAPKDLSRRVAATRGGSSAQIEVMRGGSRQVLAAQVDRMPDRMQTAQTGPSKKDPHGGTEVMGLKLATLDPQARARFGIDKAVDGVLVAGVERRAELPLRAGDVIVEVANEPVAQPAEVARKVDAAREAGRKSVLLLVHRGGSNQYVALNLKQG